MGRQSGECYEICWSGSCKQGGWDVSQASAMRFAGQAVASREDGTSVRRVLWDLLVRQLQAGRMGRQSGECYEICWSGSCKQGGWDVSQASAMRFAGQAVASREDGTSVRWVLWDLLVRQLQAGRMGRQSGECYEICWSGSCKQGGWDVSQASAMRFAGQAVASREDGTSVRRVLWDLLVRQLQAGRMGRQSGECYEICWSGSCKQGGWDVSQASAMRFAGQAVAYVAGSACQAPSRRGSGPYNFQILLISECVTGRHWATQKVPVSSYLTTWNITWRCEILLPYCFIEWFMVIYQFCQG